METLGRVPVYRYPRSGPRPLRGLNFLGPANRVSGRNPRLTVTAVKSPSFACAFERLFALIAPHEIRVNEKSRDKVLRLSLKFCLRPALWIPSTHRKSSALSTNCRALNEVARCRAWGLAAASPASRLA